MPRLIAATLPCFCALPRRRSPADHGGPLRDAPMSPLTFALIAAGAVLAAGVLVVIIVLALTRKTGRVSGAATALRWAHLLFALLLVGMFGFSLLAGRRRIPRRAPGSAHARARAGAPRWPRSSPRRALLALHAAYVAGRSGRRARAGGVVARATSTQFGAVWLLRVGVIACSSRSCRPASAKTPPRTGRRCAGRPGCSPPPPRARSPGPAMPRRWSRAARLALAADLVHLVAAGVWLGALAPLHCAAPRGRRRRRARTRDPTRCSSCAASRSSRSSPC